MDIPAESPPKKRERAWRAPATGEDVVWPAGVEKKYDISAQTRWRWERSGRLPPRDVNMAGKTGWKPATLTASERNPAS